MNQQEQITGMILRIEKSSMHDGEGLRTVVFLKGCNLRCAWCSTPESQSAKPEKGFDAVRCQACDRCLAACPTGALSRRADGFMATDRALCTDCFACVAACPYQAYPLYGKSMTVAQVMAEVLKDEIFYFHSGGGLTISGGEPLLQADFCTELFRRCHKGGIDTAVETGFAVPWPEVEKILPDLDTLFVDIKHCDPGAHRQWVGVDNALTLENIRRADQFPAPLQIVARVPVIPGLNDSAENLLATAEFCSKLTKLQALQLLPYHRLGTATYTKLDRDYALPEIASPDKITVAAWNDLIASHYPQLPLWR